MICHLTLEGDLPAKKNKLKPRAAGSAGRAHMYDAATNKALADLQIQAQSNWNRRGYPRNLVHPDVTVRMYVFNLSKDRDGIWTTILDILRHAGILFEDNIRHFNGTVIMLPAIPCVKRSERIELTFTTKE